MCSSLVSGLQIVFEVVVNELSAAGVECLLVGGFAVNHYGYSRSTLDIDFMVVSDDRDAVLDAMRQAGFTSYSIHANITSFQRPGETLRVDFLNTDSETMAKLVSRAVRADFFWGQCPAACITRLAGHEILRAVSGAGTTDGKRHS